MKRRFIFTFNEEALAHAEDLIKKGNYKSEQPFVDVISDSLNLMYEIRKHYDRGFTNLMISTFDGEEKVGFYLPNLFGVRSAAKSR